MVTSVTDARGNSASYTYDGTTRQTVSVTDALNQETRYTYYGTEGMLRLKNVVSAGTGKVSYDYDSDGRLTEVARNKDGQDTPIPGTVYRMAYDSWGRNASTAVGSRILSSNTYDAYGRLVSVTYGNGYREEYTYDSQDRIAAVSRGQEGNLHLSFSYTYDGEGNLYELRNHETGRSTFFRYDHAGRCVASEEKAFTESGPTGTVSSYRYEYDACNRLSKLTCTTDGSAWETVYTYDRDGRAKTVTLHNGTVMTNTYDSLGRLQYRDIGLTANYRTELTYLAGAGTNSTTALLESYRNGSDDAYVYSYDANGNIISISQGSTAVTYTYNSANELIREDNGFTGETVTYSYDPWGNMLEKVTYAYNTAETLSNPTETVTYSYGNTDWQDELTGISTTTAAGTVTETISYDDNGNAVSYRGATLAWNGKQLSAYTKGADTVTYAYDANGLRSRKTVNNETTDYYYNGSILMSLVTGDDILLFSYDQAGNVVSVNHNGTEYYYLRNGQGDITALIDGTGAKVTEYVYNSWGEVISLAGSHASDIGTLNPFRYRSYVYDEETGLYYLQSRYYDPEICRFLSSDVLLSTGQGVLGHNAFAYCRNTPVTSFDVFGKEDEVIYIFYTAYSENESENGEGDFTNQALFCCLICNVIYNSKNVFPVEVNTVDDFVREWNRMENEVSKVFIYSHGNGKSLIFQDGDGINSTGVGINGNEIHSLSELKCKKIDSLYLMSCNSGHVNLYREQKTNAAVEFLRMGGIKKVFAFDGNMAFIGGKIPFFSKEQGGYLGVYENNNIKSKFRVPLGWVEYSKRGQ